MRLLGMRLLVLNYKVAAAWVEGTGGDVAARAARAVQIEILKGPKKKTKSHITTETKGLGLGRREPQVAQI